MKKILNTFIFASLMVVVSSCTAKYEDINSNPYQPATCLPTTMLWVRP